MTTIAIVSPGHPDKAGGVTDHTSRLERSWSEGGHEVLISSELSGPPRDTVARWTAHGTSAVLIQYVPFLYGRRGLSRYPEGLAAAARFAGMKVSIFIHEPWVPLTRPQWLILGPLQRLQLHRLMRRVSSAVTAVPAWQMIVAPKPKLVYVGSTLPAVPLSDPDFLDSPVVFSPFAAGLNWEWIVQAARAISAPRGLVIIGATEAEARKHPIAQWIRPGWDWRGHLSAKDAGALLARARLVLAPFIDGVTGRRTSACAALAAGARVLSSTGHLFDPFFRVTLDVASSAQEFSGRAAQVWAADDTPEARKQRRQWYDQHLAPRVLDSRLLRLMLS